MHRTLINLVGLAATWAAWLWLTANPLTPRWNLIIAVVGVLALFPFIFGGRYLLDHTPTVARAVWVTNIIHYAVAIFFGSAVIAAYRFGASAESWPVSLPPWLGLGVMALGALVLSAVIFTLIARGLGTPFAAALTRVVVTDWLYAWTRNPMVLSALAFLVGLGLWLGSALFIIWVLVVVSPMMLVFLKVYEERELEIRFGSDYLDYRQRTPMLIPRRPRPG
jgi:protein-S-isoprenylcysteine O-methyltransferase Ste14